MKKILILGLLITLAGCAYGNKSGDGRCCKKACPGKTGVQTQVMKVERCPCNEGTSSEACPSGTCN